MATSVGANSALCVILPNCHHLADPIIKQTEGLISKHRNVMGVTAHHVTRLPLHMSISSCSLLKNSLGLKTVTTNW